MPHFRWPERVEQVIPVRGGAQGTLTGGEIFAERECDQPSDKTSRGNRHLTPRTLVKFATRALFLPERDAS